ncbi:hypothetical protein MNBD_PLANCTO02-3172, partial [hydrothermal vent metagenome]
ALQTKVRKLESSLQQKQKMSSPAMPMSNKKQGGMKMGSGMKMKKKMMGMGMPGMKKKPMMGGMSAQGKPAMGRMGMGLMGGKGMSMMGKMKGMGAMKMPSSLPGFPGASHIYHIGATSFFLDHPQHITLTKEQQIKLNAIKEKTLLEQATSNRFISQGEQELWVLTSSDTPNASKIEAKIQKIAKLSSSKRIAYIRAVGKAAKILTNEQRQRLVGNLPAGHKKNSEGKSN